MPPVLDLSVAVVAVRTFAISRGVLRYCERLATHDAALRAAGTAREQIYHRLADGPAAAAVRLHSGELVARVGADVDNWPTCWCAPWCRSASRRCWRWRRRRSVGPSRCPPQRCWRSAWSSPACVAPWLAGRAAAAQEAVARQHHSERDTSAMIALEHAPELRVAGALPEVIAESQRRQRAWGEALDAAADRPLSPRRCRPRRSESACSAQ